MFTCEICEIFQSTYFEEHLRKNSSICFVESQLDETSTEWEVVF